MENFQCSSVLPNIKYNCVVLFLSQFYLLFIYASKYFLVDHHCKSQTEFMISSQKAKFIDVPAGCVGCQIQLIEAWELVMRGECLIWTTNFKLQVNLIQDKREIPFTMFVVRSTYVSPFCPIWQIRIFNVNFRKSGDDGGGVHLKFILQQSVLIGKLYM